MEPITVTVIVTAAGILVAIVSQFLKSQAMSGEPFSLPKTLVVGCSGALIIASNLLAGQPLDPTSIGLQVMAVTGIALTTDAATKVAVNKSTTLTKVVSSSTLLENTGLIKYKDEPIRSDAGTKILPTDQLINSGEEATLVLYSYPGNSDISVNRIVEATIEFGDGSKPETFPVANGVAVIKHRFVHTGSNHVEESKDIDGSVLSAAGVVTPIIKDNDPDRHAAHVNVRRVSS